LRDHKNFSFYSSYCFLQLGVINSRGSQPANQSACFLGLSVQHHNVYLHARTHKENTQQLLYMFPWLQYVPVKIWDASLKKPSARRKREFAAREAGKCKVEKYHFFSTRREKVHAVIFISDALSANERARPMLRGCCGAMGNKKRALPAALALPERCSQWGGKLFD
jgi:hypothetical protein